MRDWFSAVLAASLSLMSLPASADQPPAKPLPADPLGAGDDTPHFAQELRDGDEGRGVGAAMETLQRELTRIFIWTEIAFPDLRFQTPERVGDGIDELIFSWPVYVAGFRVKGEQAGVSLFVEPELPANHLAFRGLSGARLWGADRNTLLALVLEGGGLVATDGHGAFAGGGPAYGDERFLIALVARRYFILGDDRWDFTLDVTFPATTLLKSVER